MRINVQGSSTEKEIISEMTGEGWTANISSTNHVFKVKFTQPSGALGVSIKRNLMQALIEARQSALEFQFSMQDEETQETYCGAY